MNVYQKITLGLAVMLSGAVSADNFVMTSPTDYRSYKSNQCWFSEDHGGELEAVLELFWA